MGRGRSLKEWLFGESFRGWYIPTEEELYRTFLRETEAEFKSIVESSSEEPSDVLWRRFLEWCIENSEFASRRLSEARLYSLQRDYYSKSLPRRIWLRLFCPRFSGMSI